MDNLTNVCEATSQSHELDNFRPTHRKGKKLLAEKKRRARINNCLVQIRNIVCEGEDDKDTDLDKMEKAEILEKTLEVLTKLRHDYGGPHSSSNSSISTRKAMAVRYASGFSSCAEESIRYIQSSRLVPTEVKVQLQNHLRAIARRMESVVQTDAQSFSSSFLPVPSSSVSPSERQPLGEEGMLPYDGRSENDISSTPSRSLFIPSPTSTSAPALQYNITHSTTPVPESFHHFNSEDKVKKSTEKHCSSGSEVERYFKDYRCQQVSHDLVSSTVYKYESVTPDYSHEPISSTYNLRSEVSYSSPLLPIKACTPSSGGSPVMVHPGLIHTTPIIPDSPIYSYRGYEHFAALGSPMIQPVHYMTAPITTSPALLTSVVKQPSTPSTALNLCVKSNEAHQISPETMWRPW